MAAIAALFDRLLIPRLDELVRRGLADHEARCPHRGLEEASDEELLTRRLVHGDESRLHLAPTAVVNNALFNLSAGHVTVGEHAFFGHNVSILTGTHDVKKFGAERQKAHPTEGRDVVIGEGVWLATNVTVLGPCTIGDNAVVGARSLVQGDVEPYAVMAGIPAKEIRRIGDGSKEDGE